MTPDASEQEFEEYVLANLDDAESRIGYYFAGLRGLIERYGAVNMAKGLVSIDNTFHMHDGFQILSDNDLQHLSVEQAMIDFQQASFFDDAHISAAKAKLYLASIKKTGGG
jgi:hypothetical protein